MEILRYVVLTNGLLAVVSLTYYVLLRRETFFGANRLALWLGLAGALGLPLLELPDWRPQPVRSVMQRTAQAIVPKVLPNEFVSKPAITITFPNGQTVPAFRNQPTKFTWSWQAWLLAAYLVGVLFLLIRFVLQLLSLKRLIRQSVHESYNDFILVRNKQVNAPFSFLNWVVLNPEQHTPDELDQILRHERVHVRERHSLDMIAGELVCIVFWFNPATYLFRHLLHQTLEFSADRAVLAEGVDAQLYQYNLVKVSLSGSQSALTNHFSKAQLKSRIVMLNKPASTNVTWLKYPVIFFAALTVASAFARPQHLKVLSKYVPKPVAETLAAMAEPTKESFQPVEKAGQMVNVKSLEPETDKSSLQDPLIYQSRPPLDSVSQQPHPDTVRVSPSRYMQYEGDKLYWIITPKTSFDDLAIMKQEFERHGYKMQVQTLKYHPQKAYISDIKITIIRPTAGVSDFEETGVDGGPIRSYGGYNGLNALNTVAAVGSYPFKDDFLHIPQGLVQITRNEELSITKLIDDKKLEGLLAEAIRKYGHLGIGPARFNKEEIIKNSSPNSSVRVTSEGFISVDKAPNNINIYINNEPATREAVQLLKIDQLYTLAVIYGYASAEQKEQKQPGTRYLLFYVNIDK